MAVAAGQALDDLAQATDEVGRQAGVLQLLVGQTGQLGQAEAFERVPALVGGHALFGGQVGLLLEQQTDDVGAGGVPVRPAARRLAAAAWTVPWAAARTCSDCLRQSLSHWFKHQPRTNHRLGILAWAPLNQLPALLFTIAGWSRWKYVKETLRKSPSFKTRLLVVSGIVRSYTKGSTPWTTKEPVYVVKVDWTFAFASQNNLNFPFTGLASISWVSTGGLPMLTGFLDWFSFSEFGLLDWSSLRKSRLEPLREPVPCVPVWLEGFRWILQDFLHGLTTTAVDCKVYTYYNVFRRLDEKVHYSWIFCGLSDYFKLSRVLW